MKISTYLVLLGLCGALTGIFIRHYLQQFVPNVLKEVKQSAQLFFPELKWQEKMSAQLQGKNYASQWFFALIFALGFCLCGMYVKTQGEEVFFAFWLNIFLSGLYVVAQLDKDYQLISPALCQGLWCWALFGVYLRFVPLSLEMSLCSSALGFFTLYAIYYLAKYCYQREALGRGDCWLLLPLSAIQPWQLLPWLLFIACLLGLAWALWRKCFVSAQEYLPFAPSLIVSGLALFFYSL